jgi:hypothetical protein
MRTETREVEEQVAYPVERTKTRTVQEPVYKTITADDGEKVQVITGYTEKEVTVAVQDVEYRTEKKTVTEEVPDSEEYPNPAPNTYTRYREAAQWCNKNGAMMVECQPNAEYPNGYYEVQAIPEPSKKEQEAALQKHYTDLIQHILDAEAQKLGYDNCNSVCTYVDTGVAKFDAEGMAFRKWRSAVWAKGYELLAEVQAGTRPIPTEEELVELLPKLEIVYA